MNKTFLSACGAFISVLATVATLAIFSTTDEALYAILAVFFAFLSLAFIGYGIEDCGIADLIANFFIEKGGEK